MTSNISTVYDRQMFDFAGNPLIVFVKKDEPWFKLVDVCGYLELTSTSKAKQQLDSDEYVTLARGDNGFSEVVSKIKGSKEGVNSNHPFQAEDKRINSITLINESGFYSLTLRCRLATTVGTVQHKFRKWVTGTVLPSIRKNGKSSTSTEWCGPPKTKNKVEVVPYKEVVNSDDLDEFGKILYARMVDAMPSAMKVLIEESVGPEFRIALAEKLAEQNKPVKNVLNDIGSRLAELETNYSNLKSKTNVTFKRSRNLEKSYELQKSILEELNNDTKVISDMLDEHEEKNVSVDSTIITLQKTVMELKKAVKKLTNDNNLRASKDAMFNKLYDKLTKLGELNDKPVSKKYKN